MKVEEIDSKQAYHMLREEREAKLVDVRTQAEWNHVGVPDLSGAGKQVICLSWRIHPDMGINSKFIEELRKHGIGYDDKLLFICKSGLRSRESAYFALQNNFSKCYNIYDGFEGELDPSNRSRIVGWKAFNLPWEQN